MKSVAFALLLLVGCTDADLFPDVITSSNGPVAGQAHEAPTTRPDAGEPLGDGGVTDGRNFDALPTAFDAGMPFDVGSPAADAPIP